MKLSIKIITFCTIFFQGNIMASPFSFAFPEQVNNLSLKSPQYLKTSDDIKLAYYDFVPADPEAIMIFYHGAGIWSTRMYQYMAQQLAEKYNIGTYLFDIRGHGNSQGPRGDAPSTEQVWQDVSSAIDFVHQQHPGSKILLGGHSSGAGLVLNYDSWHKHPAVSGYVLLAPFLGALSGTTYEHTDPDKRFAKDVCLFKIIINSLTSGFFFANTPVIFFNYPEEEKKKDAHLLESHTCAMTQATSPYDPKAIFTKLDKPFIMFAAAHDEQFIPDKIVEFGSYATLVSDCSIAQIIPDATHLSLVMQAPELIAHGVQKILSK